MASTSRLFRSEPWLVVAAAGLLAVTLTWPLAARLGSAGRVDTGDGRYSAWNVAWVAHALTTDPVHVYDANIFYPHKGTLAYSEPNLLAGALAIPAWLATGNALAAWNWTTLCAFALAAICAYALARRLTGSPGGAAVAGLIYAFCPFAFSHIPHIQLLMTFGPPLALLAMHRFVDAPSWRRAVFLGLAVAVQALACGYYGIFGGLAVALGVVWFGVASGRWRRPTYWAFALGAAAVAVLVVAPFFFPYLGIRGAGFTRSLDDARAYRADWRSYLASPLLLHRWILPLIGEWREVLFPGFVGLALATVAVVRTWRAPGSSQPAGRPTVVGFYLALGALAFWGSFGPDAGLYTLLYKTVPFFSMLRAPSRLGLLVTLATSVLAGVGMAGLSVRLAGRRRRVLLLAVLAVTLARSTVGPLWLAAAPAVSTADRRLAALPRGPVVEFPYFRAAGERHEHTEYMLASTVHWQPLLNGYSDYMPPDAFEDMLALAQFPDDAAWRVMQRQQVRYVVVHWTKYDAVERARLHEQLRALSRQLRLVVDDGGAALFEVVGWPKITA